MLRTPGPIVIQFRGRMIARAHGFVDVPELLCPDRHSIKLHGFSIADAGGLTCNHRPSAGSGQCGALFWLLYMPGPYRTKRFFAADVEYAELDLFERHGATVPEILRYLGAWFIR